MGNAPVNHYETLGLHRACTEDDIRMAYRALVKLHHPDAGAAATDRIQAINEAYAALKDPVRRRAHDAELDATAGVSSRRSAPVAIKEEVRVSIVELLRGVTIEVQVRDPANPKGPELYELMLPPGTAPGARFTIPRDPPFEKGVVHVRVKLRPDARFKARGSDLRCDLNIRMQRAETGGVELVRGPDGAMLSVKIPARIARADIVKVPGAGLPKTRGGRGDLLVRIMYRPEVRITRGATPTQKATSSWRRPLPPGR